jgi:hypothetical protein
MTKKELMQHYYLNKEILQNTEELVNLKINGRTNSDFTWSRASEEEIERQESIIVEKIKKCRILQKNINDFLNTVDDSLTRQIFSYRFLKCMSWKQVAYMVGGNNTEDSVRKISERYLKKINQKK